jgi:antitoxin HigA-1
MDKKYRRLGPIHPGEILFEDFIKPMGISINRLARDIAVAPSRISAIVKHKRAITADTALRLGKYFDVTPQTWMGLQTEYDLRVAQRAIGDEVDKRVQRHAA